MIDPKLLPPLFAALVFAGTGCTGDNDPVVDTGVVVIADAAPPADTGASLEDAGDVDASVLDAGEALLDAMAVDAEPMDADGEDAGVGDGPVADEGPADAEAADADPNDADPNDADPTDADPNDADPNDADPADADPAEVGADAEPGDAGPEDSGSVADAGMADLTCNPAFGMADACGGNPVGMWTYQAACLDQSVFAPLQQGCPTAMTRNVVHSVSGTLNLTAVGTYERNSVDNITGNIDVPPSCAPAAIGGCFGAAAIIQNAIPGSSVTCTTLASGGCDCPIVINQTIVDSGTYTVDPVNGVASMNPAAGIPEQVYYCVDNGVARYRGIAGLSSNASISYVLTP